jgi:hypothetical protein
VLDGRRYECKRSATECGHKTLPYAEGPGLPNPADHKGLHRVRRPATNPVRRLLPRMHLKPRKFEFKTRRVKYSIRLGVPFPPKRLPDHNEPPFLTPSTVARMACRPVFARPPKKGCVSIARCRNILRHDFMMNDRKNQGWQSGY